ncbi:MAG: hypothetical protein E7326_08520 [Clostridiales bacterium]|nr:hypothetical protein [Clostridiales bacterium]
MLTDRFLYLRFLIRGANAEKAVNAIRSAHIPLHHLRRRRDRAIVCRCKKQHLCHVHDACSRFSCSVTQLPAPFLSRLLLGLLKRKSFCIGSLVFLIVMYIAMQHVWSVQILDAGPYEGDIRAYLVSAGVTPGIRKDEVDAEKIRAALEWRYPQLAWIKTDFHGVSFRVTAVQGIPTPDMIDESRTGDVVAAQDGIVHSVITLAGTAQVKPGDFVRAGQVLILGQERTKDGGTKPVRAQGQINARIWIEKKAVLNASETLTLPSGNRFERKVFVSPFFSLSDAPPPNYASFDLESASHVLGGAWLPLFVTRETYEEITLSHVPRDTESLRLEAARAAEKMLLSSLKSGDVTVDKWVDYSMIEMESYAAVAVAEVLRDIGRFSGR